MSEQTDDAQKTEEPTQKKLDEARSRGQVALSREINTWLMLLAGTVVVIMLMPRLLSDVAVTLSAFVERPHQFALDSGAAGRVLTAAFTEVLFVLLIPLLIFFVVALAGPILQNGIVFSPKAVEPKVERFSPARGLKRIFSARQFAEFLKGIFKLAIVGTIGALAIYPSLPAMDTLPNFAVSDALLVLHELVTRMLIAILVVLVVIAVADLVFQRQQHLKTMRMTRQEVKDEFRQSEGDPIVKQRLRQIRQERARARMMQAVPEADVVVTNPTHFAVALKYKPEEMPAPRLVAKGADLIAQRIREVAEEHGIAIVENPPLARALFASVELDEEVPPEHYQAVAEVISYVWRLEGRRMPKESQRAG